MLKHLITMLIFIVFAGCAASNNYPQKPYTWTKIWKSMSINSLPALARKLNDDPEAHALVDKTLNQINTLYKIWSGDYDYDKDYLMGMTLEAYLLEKAAKEMPADSAKEVLKDIASDIEIKLNHCQKHPDGKGSRVNLKVSTVSASGDSKGWQVFHVLVGNYRFLNTPGQPLRKFSSPAEGSVSVGNNLIWAMKGDKKTKEQIFPVGFGKDDQEIEIPVP